MTCRPQTIAALALGVTLLVGCSAAVERPCSFWSPRVSSDAEAELAMARVAAHHCVEARDQVLGRLADPALRADALETLVALGRTPETEQAVVAALAWPETVARAASLVLRWRLRGAEVALGGPEGGLDGSHEGGHEVRHDGGH